MIHFFRLIKILGMSLALLVVIGLGFGSSAGASTGTAYVGSPIAGGLINPNPLNGWNSVKTTTQSSFQKLANKAAIAYNFNVDQYGDPSTKIHFATESWKGIKENQLLTISLVHFDTKPKKSSNATSTSIIGNLGICDAGTLNNNVSAPDKLGADTYAVSCNVSGKPTTVVAWSSGSNITAVYASGFSNLKNTLLASKAQNEYLKVTQTPLPPPPPGKGVSPKVIELIIAGVVIVLLIVAGLIIRNRREKQYYAEIDDEDEHLDDADEPFFDEIEVWTEEDEEKTH